jgi:HK97 family phage major capsid protein
MEGLETKQQVENLISEKAKSAAEGLLKEKLAGLVKSEDLEKEVKAIAEGIVNGIKVKHGDTEVDLNTAVKSIQDHLDTLSIKQAESINKTKGFLAEFKEQFKAKKAELENVVKSGSGFVSFDFKAVSPIGLGNFGERVIPGYREPGIDKPVLPIPFIMQLITVMNGGPGSNPLYWIEQVPKEGLPAWTAESALKPGMDWTYKENKATAEMLAAWVATTRQAVLNWPILEQEINVELTRQIYNVLEQSLITGDGTNNSIFGIDYYAIPFAAGALAGTVPQANVADVIRAAIGQVRKGAAVATPLKGGFRPNAALVSEDTATSMDLDKNADGIYVLPPFKSQDGTIIKGVPVISSNFIEGDDFYVGDFSRYLFNVVDGLRIDVGLVNDQFIRNQFTIRAEMYGAGRMRFNERPAIVKGDFSTAIGALNDAA